VPDSASELSFASDEDGAGEHARALACGFYGYTEYDDFARLSGDSEGGITHARELTDRRTEGKGFKKGKKIK